MRKKRDAAPRPKKTEVVRTASDRTMAAAIRRFVRLNRELIRDLAK